MSFERACALDDVRPGEALGVALGDREVALGRDGDEVFAVEDLCSHAAVALSEGEVETKTDKQGAGVCAIECWLHGSLFDMRTGQPTGLPATEPVATYPVEIRDGDVYVDVTTTLNGVTPS